MYRLPFTSAYSVEPNNEFLQAIFKAIAEGGGKCVAALAMLARDLEHEQVNHAQRGQFAQA